MSEENRLIEVLLFCIYRIGPCERNNACAIVFVDCLLKITIAFRPLRRQRNLTEVGAKFPLLLYVVLGAFYRFEILLTNFDCLNLPIEKLRNGSLF